MAKAPLEIRFSDEQLAHIKDMVEETRQEWRNNLITVANLAYKAGQKHDPIGKQELVNAIIAGRWDA